MINENNPINKSSNYLSQENVSSQKTGRMSGGEKVEKTKGNLPLSIQPNETPKESSNIKRHSTSKQSPRILVNKYGSDLIEKFNKANNKETFLKFYGDLKKLFTNSKAYSLLDSSIKERLAKAFLEAKTRFEKEDSIKEEPLKIDIKEKAKENCLSLIKKLNEVSDKESFLKLQGDLGDIKKEYSLLESNLRQSGECRKKNESLR